MNRNHHILMGCSMNFRRVAAIMAIALLTSSVVTAQPRSVTLDEAIRIAAQHNRELEIARLEMEKADYRVNEAYGTALPTVTAAGTYTRALKKPVFFLPDFSDLESGRIIPIEIGSDNSYQFGFSASQVLFNAAVITGVGTAKIYQKASRHLYDETFNKTVADVKKAFYGVLFAKDVVRMVQASLANAEKNLSNVQLLFDQGIVSEYDLIRAQVQTGNIRPNVIEAERNVNLALNGLKMLLGIPPSETLDVTGELRYEPVDPVIAENAASIAMEKNSGLQALQDQMRVNEKLVTIYRAESMPTLVAFADYQWQAQNEHLGRISTNDFVRSSQVGVQLSLNLFNGLQTSSRVDQARVNFLQTEQQFSAAKDGMVTNIQNIRFRLDEARKRIETQSNTVDQAEKGYAIATVRYQDGSGTQLEVNDADLALMRAKVNRVQAVFDYLVAQADFEQTLSLHHP